MDAEFMSGAHGNNAGLPFLGGPLRRVRAGELVPVRAEASSHGLRCWAGRALARGGLVLVPAVGAGSTLAVLDAQAVVELRRALADAGQAGKGVQA